MSTIKDLILFVMILGIALAFVITKSQVCLIVFFLALIVFGFLISLKSIFYYKNKYQALLDIFTNVLNHDLKVSTLAQIRGLELLEDELASSKCESDLIEDIKESCNYSLDMITSLLKTYSKEELKTIKAEAVSPLEIFQTVKNKSSYLIEKKNVTIKFFENTKDLAKADKQILTEIFETLLVSALQSCFKKSVIVVLLRGNSNQLEFNIGFNGRAYSKRECENLLAGKTVFSTVGQSIKIQLCKKLLESLGGNLFIKSKDGDFNYFTFTIPKNKSEKLVKPLVLTTI